MSDEIDDNEFFQQDFTTASEWEVFNARLEEIFHEWKLPFVQLGRPLEQNELDSCEWDVTSEVTSIAAVKFNVVRYCAKLPQLESEDDENITVKKENTCQAFEDVVGFHNIYSRLDENAHGTLHPIARWYGLRDFVVISLASGAIKNESQIKILMSSVYIAVAESNCEVPVFVQMMERNQNVFGGVCEFQSKRLSFDIVHLRSAPPTCRYLTGLLDIFKGKVTVRQTDIVTVSVRLSYNLLKFPTTEYGSKRKSILLEQHDDVDTVETINKLPFGIANDPVSEIILNCTWPQVAENVVVDSQIYSDFDPMVAPVWSLRSRFVSDPVCLMSECLTEFLQISEYNKTLFDLLGDGYVYNAASSMDGHNPFEVLTESKLPKLPSVLTNLSARRDAKKSQRTEGPIRDELLMLMLYFMFPDAQPDSTFGYQVQEGDNFDPLKIKSAVSDSLVHRLAIVLALCNNQYGGIQAVAQLWAEFAQEMRYRVEMCIQIPGVADGFPDSRTCLLHQKLQMLNICMERRRIREGGLPFAMTNKRKSGPDDSEDEFFDCTSDEEEDKTKHQPWNKPEGRLSRLGDMTLVDSDEPLYVPITQEPVPKTEDQLEDDAEVMLKLGPGSELRAQMMSASLLSDMESFKAANPNGKIEDFIRWYSPRDWIEDEVKDEGDTSALKNTGQLSSRMLIPGNTWQLVWGTAKPVSARRQKRLFDDTIEAEKVLHFLESRNIGQICRLTIAALFHSTILRIKEEFESTSETTPLPDFTENYKQLKTICCKLSRENWTSLQPNVKALDSMKKWENLLADITNLEYLVVKSRSLIRKLFSEDSNLKDEDTELIKSLLRGYDTDLINGSRSDIGQRVLYLFKQLKHHEQPSSDEDNQEMHLPAPFEKQFTLRVCGAVTNSPYGGPQFMRAILGHNEFRLCGAFCEDTTFI